MKGWRKNNAILLQNMLRDTTQEIVQRHDNHYLESRYP